MAFQTHVEENGQWVTRTVDYRTLLSPNTAPSGPNTDSALPPDGNGCGVLTRTIVPSPLVHWVLPAQLRSVYHNDVALVGDHLVQIKEFRQDGLLHDVLNYNNVDLGSRIVNARVLGFPEFPDHGSGDFFHELEPLLNLGYELLPTQLLLLALECGDLLFLFIQSSAPNYPVFKEHRFRLPAPMHVCPGFHLAVDPSSRYLAVANTEGVFFVHELETTAGLRQQYSLHGSISPIRNSRPRVVEGVIHKIEFLYPRPGDSTHIILLLVVAGRGRSWIVIYDWKAGDDLDTVLPREQRVHRLSREHQMPLLLIPLTVRNAFFAVSQDIIGVFRDPLQGLSMFDDIPTNAPATRFHHGNGPPLWTAWARPYRRKDYQAEKDNIYLAREDGVVMFFEINSDDVVATSTTYTVTSNISTAFTVIPERWSDVLIVGGEAGVGSIWKSRAKEDLCKVGVVPQWGPVLDFVTTDPETSWKPAFQDTNPMFLKAPCRIFATSGRGVNGAITELRWGVQANTVIDIDYGEPIRQCWVFPANPLHFRRGVLILIALPDCSSVLHIPSEADEAIVPDDEVVQLDTTSRTLAAARISGDRIVQITENSATILFHSRSVRHTHAATFGTGIGSVYGAAISDSFIAISAQTHDGCRVHIARIDNDNLAATKDMSVGAEVTCLAFCSLLHQPYLLAGQWSPEGIVLSVYDVHDDQATPKVTALLNCGDGVSLVSTAEVASPMSIAVVSQELNKATAVMGSRSGLIVTIEVSGPPSLQLQMYVEQMAPASASVRIFPSASPGPENWSALACFDSVPILLTDFDSKKSPGSVSKHRIHLVDNNHPGIAAPPISSAVWLDDDCLLSPADRRRRTVLFVAGSRILFANLDIRPGMVPRWMPIKGAPTKLVYSHALNCLVVAVQYKEHEERPTILFVDPETGGDISSPEDKDHTTSVEFLSGLGQTEDRIYGLYEWRFPKDGKTFLFIVVTTKQGRLLVISPEVQYTEASSPGTTSRLIRHWIRYKKRYAGAPIYSVVADEEGLVFCAGNTLHWETLDLADKKLKPRKHLKLDSPATSLRIENGMVFALTANHSLLIIKRNGGTGDEMALLHGDEVSRRTMHFANLGHSADGAWWPITLLSDRYRGIAGLRGDFNASGKELTLVFEGRVPASVRRFRRGRTRPFWSQLNGQPRFGRLRSTVDDADVLGMSLDGSLQSFTLLSRTLWRFLNLIQGLAKMSQASPPGGINSPTTYETPIKAEPINGDILEQIVVKRNLETIFLHHVAAFDSFRELLGSLEGCGHVAELELADDPKPYFDLAYEVLEYLLSPVI